MSISRREFIQASAAAGLLASTPLSAGPHDLIVKAIPSTGETIPVVGLGTNRYGVGDDAAARAPLKAALARFHLLGGTVIDTAPMYRSSEAVLGELIAELGIREELFIATKTDRNDGADANREQMRLSQERLQTDSFELMQVHNLRGWREALAAMRDWRDAGRIRYLGITTSRSNQYEEFEAIMRAEELDFVQLNYSLSQQEAGERLLPLAADRGIAVLVNRPFGGGRIFERLGDRPLPDWAADYDCASWGQFLLKYVVSHPAVTAAIPGMTKVRHVDDNVMAAHGRLPDLEGRRLMARYFAEL